MQIFYLQQKLNIEHLHKSRSTMIVIYCGNRSALHIAAYPVIHERRTKRVEIDWCFVRKKVQLCILPIPTCKSL
ncbi:hypothetical protein CR513_53386, partial [Mucuna pruriens]